jgi:hypothetical protein
MLRQFHENSGEPVLSADGEHASSPIYTAEMFLLYSNQSDSLPLQSLLRWSDDTLIFLSAGLAQPQRDMRGLHRLLHNCQQMLIQLVQIDFIA